MRLLTYLYRDDDLHKIVGYAWIYLNRNHCKEMIRRMEIFLQAVKQDPLLRSLVFECDGALDPVAEFFLCDPLDDLDRYLSDGVCIFPVPTLQSPVQGLAVSIDEDSRMDEEVDDMILDGEMDLRTFSHLGQAETLIVSRSACEFHGRPSGAEFSYRTSPIGKALIVECKNMETSEAGSANPQMDIVDYFQAELRRLIKDVWRLRDPEAEEDG